MPAGIQWLLGVPLGLVVVTVVGVAVTASQGAMPGVSAALTAFGVLGLWVIRLRRDGYYRALAAAICTGAAAALTVVGALIKSINWG
jgi:MYXO-CTERM domain-containing protein